MEQEVSAYGYQAMASVKALYVAAHRHITLALIDGSSGILIQVASWTKKPIQSNCKPIPTLVKIIPTVGFGIIGLGARKIN